MPKKTEPKKPTLAARMLALEARVTELEAQVEDLCASMGMDQEKPHLPESAPAAAAAPIPEPLP